MPRIGSVGHISIIPILNDNVTRELARLKWHVVYRNIGGVILRHLHIILPIECITLDQGHIRTYCFEKKKDAG